MRISPSHPMPPADNGAAHSELAALRAARWEHEQEIDSLKETIGVYREGATVLAAQITELRHELASRRTATTRERVYAAQHELEITLACDEDTPAVIALVIGESLSNDHTESTVEACQAIASELLDHCLLRTETEQTVSLRIRHSELAIGIEIVPPQQR
jgi:hypothetical protein